jgi:Putative MetA-pathway of phenol degradation
MPRTIDARSIVRDYNAVNLFVFVPVSAIRWGVLKAPRAVLMLVLLAMIPSIPPALAAEIEPDRPEVTESARLVPRGAVQLESGLAFSSERRAGLATEKTFEADANLRMGVSRHVELNLGWEPLVRVRGPEDDTGIGDVTLGVRYRFVEGFEDELWPPHLAVKVFAKLPAAAEPLGTGRPDFGVLLLASFELWQDFELEVNVGAAAIGQTRPSGFLGQAIATASLSRDLAPSLLGFVELLFNSREERGGREQLALNVGLVYRLTSTLAVDAGVQTSVVGQGPDYVVRTGLSVLWR